MERTAETMRAAYVERLGGAEEIRCGRLPRPTPGPGEALVRVERAAVDHVDTFVRSGAYRTRTPFPFVVGRDAVGEVVATGPATPAVAAGSRAGHAPAVGDRVWTGSIGLDGRQGAAAEYAVVPLERLYLAPPDVDPDVLVALVHPAATGFLAVTVHGGLPAVDPAAASEPDERPTVLVVGAAGNVGSAAVAFARRGGARVVGTASGGHVDLLRERGVDLVLGHGELDRLAALVPGGVDLAVDTSGRVAPGDLIGHLAPRGRLVALAGMGLRADFALGDLYTHDRSLVGFAISNARVDELVAAADAIEAALAEDRLPAPQVERIGLEDVGAAHARLERGTLRGTRIVVDVTR